MTNEMSRVLETIRQAAATTSSLEELQGCVVREIARNLHTYDWVGIYKVDRSDPEMLILGQFVGEPTPHVKIPVSQGICGAAVREGETIIVDDVNADPRYLSCSIKTKSEIVVPICVNGRVVGEIDIDSHVAAAFTQEDRDFLEQCATIIAAAMDRTSQTWL